MPDSGSRKTTFVWSSEPATSPDKLIPANALALPVSLAVCGVPHVPTVASLEDRATHLGIGIAERSSTAKPSPPSPRRPSALELRQRALLAAPRATRSYDS
ncbi:hypothetical protein KM043_003279 [Ampulex compressa]|nr:hypothetical protein KM043_003279 [Ampulex compressa]